MKLLTLNTHSLQEPEYEKKLKVFCKGIEELKPDIIALQEVNQPSCGDVIQMRKSYSLKQGNHLERVRKILEHRGIMYHTLWYGFKRSYGIYDEGLGIMSGLPIESTRFVRLSKVRDDWKLRYALGVRMGDVWYYSVHTGRPEDKDEPFTDEIERLMSELRGKRAVVMGDFNCPDTYPEYVKLKTGGLYDTFDIAKCRTGHYTAESKIDGWGEGDRRMRIDYIFTNFETEVSTWQTVFTPERYGVVSDHFGVYVTIA